MNVLPLFRSYLTVGLLAFGLFVAGCETTAPVAGGSSDKSASPAKNTPPPADPLKVGDKIKIEFPSVSDNAMRSHEETIKDDGSIHLDLIDDVKAAGLSPRQLEKAIHDLYVPAYYKRITVVVTPDSRYFYVGGAVNKPDRQLYTGNMTVVRALQSAGDFTDFADRKKVLVRRVDGKTEIVNVIKARLDPKLDLPIYPGDSIHVPQSLY